MDKYLKRQHYVLLEINLIILLKIMLKKNILKITFK